MKLPLLFALMSILLLSCSNNDLEYYEANIDEAKKVRDKCIARMRESKDNALAMEIRKEEGCNNAMEALNNINRIKTQEEKQMREAERKKAE